MTALQAHHQAPPRAGDEIDLRPVDPDPAALRASSALIELRITPAERDDLELALRSWIGDLLEPLAKPRSALARRRRAKAGQLEDFADRVAFAGIVCDRCDHRAHRPAPCRACGTPGNRLDLRCLADG